MGLLRKDETETTVIFNIQKNLGLEWDEKTKQWNNLEQPIGFYKEETIDESNFASLELSNDNAAAILKDCKSVLSNINQITKRMDSISKDIKKVVDNIQEIVVVVSQIQK